MARFFLFAKLLLSNFANKNIGIRGMKILIIGVGSAGVIAADKMNVPNSKKLFVDSSNLILNEVKSEGEKIGLFSPYCNCMDNPDLCREVVAEYEDEIRESIVKAFIIKD